MGGDALGGLLGEKLLLLGGKRTASLTDLLTDSLSLLGELRLEMHHGHDRMAR
ncbi:hypothetical protein GGER_42120 [Serratia rubidaea]